MKLLAAEHGSQPARQMPACRPTSFLEGNTMQSSANRENRLFLSSAVSLALFLSAEAASQKRSSYVTYPFQPPLTSSVVKCVCHSTIVSTLVFCFPRGRTDANHTTNTNTGKNKSRPRPALLPKLRFVTTSGATGNANLTESAQ